MSRFVVPLHSQQSRTLLIFGPVPPPYGGVAIFMQTFSELLKKENIQHCIIDSDRTKLTFSVMRELSKLYPRALFIDNSSLFFEYPLRFSIFQLLLLRLVFKFRMLKIFHSSALPQRYAEFGYFRKRRFNFSLSFFDQSICVSQPLHSWFEKQFSKRSCHYISSLLPLTALPRAVNKDKNKITVVGAFVPLYGFEQVVEAVEHLRIRYKDLHLTLIVAGFSEDIIYKQQVLRHRPWITVLKDIPHFQAREEIASSAVFVRATQSDSAGLSKVEALWCNTPVICTPQGLSEGMHTYDFGDVERLKALLERLLQTPEAFLNKSDQVTYENLAQQNAQQFIHLIKRCTQ